MPKSKIPRAAVAGDGRKSMSLSDPYKSGLKSAMDHTRRGDLARTNFKAPARILKQSKGCSKGALE